MRATFFKLLWEFKFSVYYGFRVGVSFEVSSGILRLSSFRMMSQRTPPNFATLGCCEGT